MKTKDFNDGVCDNCGNTGLAGERCLVCGGVLAKIDDGIDDPMMDNDDDFQPSKEEPEVYPLDMIDEQEGVSEDTE